MKRKERKDKKEKRWCRYKTGNSTRLNDISKNIKNKKLKRIIPQEQMNKILQK